MENQAPRASYYEDEQEINLISLMFSVMHKYRLIIAAALICAVLAGGYSLLQDRRTQQAIASGSSASTSAMEDYEAAMTEYRDNLTKYNDELEGYRQQLADNEKSQTNTKASLANAEEYRDKSLLNSIDPYNVHIARADLYISTDYQIMPGMSYQNRDYTDAVINVYYNRLNGSDTVCSIAEKLGTEEPYLRELIAVSHEENSSLLTVSVQASSAADANAILDDMLAVVDASHDEINNKVGSHTVSLVSRIDATTVSAELRDSQQAAADNLTSLQAQLDTLTEAHEDIEQNIDTTQQALDALTEPKAPKMGASLVKYGVIGLVLGVFLAVCYAAVRFLLEGKVHSAADLKDNCHLPIIGTLAGEAAHRAKGIDARLNRLEKRADPSADEEGLRLIAATINSRAPQAQSVLITGDLPAERLNALAEALRSDMALSGRSVSAAGSVLRSAAAVPMASAADAIVLAADCGVTTYSSVNAQAEQLGQLGKSVLGCVVYE